MSFTPYQHFANEEQVPYSTNKKQVPHSTNEEQVLHSTNEEQVSVMARTGTADMLGLYTDAVYTQSPKAPNQQQYTLLFKKHKTTIVLVVAQSQSFTSIKVDLLNAMKSRSIEDINGDPLPLDPEAIVFGVPIDKNYPGKGWVPLEIPEVSDTDTKRKGVKKGSVLNQSPLGAGLTDMAMLAFKFKDPDAADIMELDDEWDVVIPSFDEEDRIKSQGRR